MPEIADIVKARQQIRDEKPARNHHRQLASPASVERHLHNLVYPATKQAILNFGKENTVPATVMRVIDKLAEKTYRSAIDLNKEVVKITQLQMHLKALNI